LFFTQLSLYGEVFMYPITVLFFSQNIQMFLLHYFTYFKLIKNHTNVFIHFLINNTNNRIEMYRNNVVLRNQLCIIQRLNEYF